jgi:hypothetical protein
MEGCGNLTMLDCCENQISALELNDLFEYLPVRQGYIHVSHNEGEHDCDRAIATNKGWIFFSTHQH